MGHAFCKVIRKKKKTSVIETFSMGIHQWICPFNVKEVDVFLVGAGGGGCNAAGGGGGYTKAFRGRGYIQTSGTWEALLDGGRDGNAITVTPGEVIEVVVGVGGVGSFDTLAGTGGFSQFKDSNYRAGGGSGANGGLVTGGSGGSGGCGWDIKAIAGSDGSNAHGERFGTGQGHTTRDFGELSGKRNAGGGGAGIIRNEPARAGGISDYADGSGANGGGYGYGYGGGGYGGGGGGGYGNNINGGKGGYGVVLIRYFV